MHQITEEVEVVEGGLIFIVCLLLVILAPEDKLCMKKAERNLSLDFFHTVV